MVSFPDNPLVSVGGYMRSDNLQLPCVQSPTSNLLMVNTVMEVMVVMLVM